MPGLLKRGLSATIRLCLPRNTSACENRRIILVNGIGPQAEARNTLISPVFLDKKRDQPAGTGGSQP